MKHLIPEFDKLRARFPDARLPGFDPVVAPAGLAGLGLEPVASLEAAFDGADAVVIQNNHPVFAGMDLATLAERMTRWPTPPATGAPAGMYDGGAVRTPIALRPNP